MTDRHGWIGSETVRTRFGDFEFRNGYPTQEATDALLDQLKFNRAVEVYLAQMPAVAMMETCYGLRDFGAKRSNQVVIWERLMDAQTLILTANTETVYCMFVLDLKNDGATVLEAPPHMLGIADDLLQRYLVDIGPLGPDRGEGGKYLFLPPDYDGEVPNGYFVVKSPTYTLQAGLRGFSENGSTEPAVALMKQTKIYPLSEAANPRPTEFLDASHQPVDTIHTDTFLFFERLAEIVQEEPDDVFTPIERFYMKEIGIEKGKPFAPSDKDRELLAEAAHVASAFARANSFASRDPETYFYPDRQWQGMADMPYTFLKDGILRIDRRAWVYYMALGNSPAMMAKNVGAGSQYLWSYKDADGEFLDGAKSYRLHIPGGIPINNFWSVVAYDSLSRSELQNDQPLPSVSQYGNPDINADGSVDVYFGPSAPAGHDKNWIQTVPGKGWFPIVRFYGPLDAYFDKTWKLNDVQKAA